MQEPSAEHLDRAIVVTAAVVVLGSFMTLLDTTIVNIAIPTVGRDFHTGLARIQWIATAYLLALSIVIPLSGWAVQRWGAKRVWLVSVALFTVGSILCAVSWSVGSLIVFRCIQGAGGGMILPVGQSLVAQAAGPRRMGRMMGLIGAPTLLAPVLGPVLGGLIVEVGPWWLIFLVNVPVGALALAAGMRIFADDTPTESARALDVTGFTLLGSGLAIVVYALSRLGNPSADIPHAVALLAVGLVLVVAFAIHSIRHRERALLDLRLLAESRAFSAAMAMSLLFSASLLGVMLLLPIYYQSVRDQGPLAAGLLMAPQGVGAICGMFASGWLTDKIGAGRVVPVGIVVGIIGTLMLTRVGQEPSLALMAGALAVRGLGLGSMMTPAIAAGLSTLPRAHVPEATTALNIVQRVSGALGTALFAVLLADGVAPGVRASLFRGRVHGSAAAVRDGLAHAFQFPFWVAVGLLGGLMLPALFLPRTAQPTAEAGALA